MAVTNFSPLLGLALPTTGDLSGTWGTTVNNSITSLLDSAVAGTTTLSVDTDVTLSTTNGAANQSRNAVILWTASNTVVRYITAPAQSKAYVVINAGTAAIVVRGAGPTTGVTIGAGVKALVAWNGTDFVNISSSVFQGVVTVEGTSASGAAIRLYEDTDNGNNYVGLKAADSIASNITFTLPNTDGTSGQVIQTNGTGTLSWADSGGAISGAGGALIVNKTEVDSSYVVATGTNAFSVGPITIADTYSITVSSGQRWVVI